MNQQKLQVASLGALLTLVAFAGIATGAGPLPTPLPLPACFPATNPACGTYNATVAAANGGAGTVNTLLAGVLANATGAVASLEAGCNMTPSPTQANGTLACILSNLSRALDAEACTALGLTGTDPQACFNTAVCAQLHQPVTAAATCAANAATQNATNEVNVLVAAVNGLIGPTPTFTGPTLSGPTGTVFPLAGMFSRDLLAPLYSLTAGNRNLTAVHNLLNVTGTLTASTGSVSNFHIDQAGSFSASYTAGTATPIVFTVSLNYVAPLSTVSALFPGKATKTATVTGSPTPVAHAGNDQIVSGGATVTLNGTTSVNAQTYSWQQLSGPLVNSTLTGNNTAVAHFTAPTVTSLKNIEFQLTVTNGALSSTDAVLIQVKPASGSTHVTVLDSPTVLSLINSSFVAPVAGAASSTGLTVRLDDSGGVGTLNNTLLSAHLVGPSLDASLSHGTYTDSNPTGDGNTRRDFPYALAFGSRLKSGAYEFAATYNTAGPVVQEFNVSNVAPTLTAPAALVRTYQSGFGPIVSDPVGISLNDANWGSFDHAPITELQSLTFTGVPTGFTAQVKTTGGSWTDVSGSSYDLSGVTNGTGALSLSVRLNSPVGNVANGTFTVKVNVTDQGNLWSGATDLYALTIRPANYGFSLSVNDSSDGSPGIALSSATPGNRINSSGDPVAVTFTGTFAASNLTVKASTFVCVSSGCDGSFSPYNSNAAKNGKALIYDNAGLSGGPKLSVSFDSTGTAFFPDLSSLSTHVQGGGQVFVVLDLYLPNGTPPGDYAGTVDVTGMGHA